MGTTRISLHIRVCTPSSVPIDARVRRSCLFPGLYNLFSSHGLVSPASLQASSPNPSLARPSLSAEGPYIRKKCATLTSSIDGASAGRTLHRWLVYLGQFPSCVTLCTTFHSAPFLSYSQHIFKYPDLHVRGLNYKFVDAPSVPSLCLCGSCVVCDKYLQSLSKRSDRFPWFSS